MWIDGKEFVLVPVEPTMEMLAAAHGDAVLDVKLAPLYMRGLRLNWDAMLAAAPSPSAVQPLSEAQIEEARAWLWKNHSVSLSGKTIRDFVGIVTPKEPENGL